MANAFTEFGRKSTGYKVGVFVAIAVVLGGLYFQFAYKKARARRNEAQADNQSALAQSQTLDKQKKEHDKNLADYKTLEKTIQENQKALPTEAELPAFFDTLGRKVAEAGVSVKRWDYLKEVPTDNFIKVPLEVEVTGTFYQIKRFFASLIQRDPVPVVKPDGTTEVEDRERIVTIENLQLLDAKGKNNELVMTARFTASTFRQEQVSAPEDPTKKPGAAGAGSAGSGSAAGSGAGSAKPPAGTPATPAGAKAATEDAMKKDATRGDDKLKGGVP
jgi:Tfp pilus assembly protein PilO